MPFFFFCQWETNAFHPSFPEKEKNRPPQKKQKKKRAASSTGLSVVSGIKLYFLCPGLVVLLVLGSILNGAGTMVLQVFCFSISGNK